MDRDRTQLHTQVSTVSPVSVVTVSIVCHQCLLSQSALSVTSVCCHSQHCLSPVSVVTVSIDCHQCMLTQSALSVTRVTSVCCHSQHCLSPESPVYVVTVSIVCHQYLPHCIVVGSISDYTYYGLSCGLSVTTLTMGCHVVYK